MRKPTDHQHRPSRPTAATLLTVLMTTCLAAALSATETETPLILSDFWIRALPPGQTVTAAYGQITNTGTTPVTLTGAVVAVAETAELHNTLQKDGRATMQRVTELVLQPQQTVTLAPGALHLMLLGLEKMPAEGSTLAVCLRSVDARSCTTATVRREDPRMHQHHH